MAEFRSPRQRKNINSPVDAEQGPTPRKPELATPNGRRPSKSAVSPVAKKRTVRNVLIGSAVAGTAVVAIAGGVLYATGIYNPFTASSSAAGSTDRVKSAQAQLNANAYDTCGVEIEGLNAALNYNGLFQGGFIGTNSDVQGRLAVGGDCSLLNFGVGDGLYPNTVSDSCPTPASNTSDYGYYSLGDYSLLVGGNFAATNTRVKYGGAIWGVDNGINMLPSDVATDCPFGQGSVLDFNAVFADLNSVSATLGGMSALTFSELDSNGAYNFYLDSSSDKQFFVVKASDLEKANSVYLLNTPKNPTDTIIINVVGSSSFSFSNKALMGNFKTYRPYILWNFYGFTSISINAQWHGSILAPKAAFEKTGSEVWGSVFGYSWNLLNNSMMQIDYQPFLGQVFSPCQTTVPTYAPTDAPTSVPTAVPTATPTAVPTNTPTATPTNTPTAAPTNAPTAAPTNAPTAAPTNAPTAAPTNTPTAAPTNTPTAAPTAAPTATPTVTPTSLPGQPTATPTVAPTAAPTNTPTAAPTNTPTAAPTNTPTAAPTNAPTAAPTNAPTAAPTNAPTAAPTNAPTNAPTAAPTAFPTVIPTAQPTAAPTPDCNYSYTGCPDTSYGYTTACSSTCFNLFANTAKWGWSMGPKTFSSSSNFDFEIWSGAGQCNLTKGTYVGVGHVYFKPSDYKVTIVLDIPDRQVSEVHIWVGKTMLPKDLFGNYITAPGQWPANFKVQAGTALTFDYPYLPSGCGSTTQLYVVAHAVVATCEQPNNYTSNCVVPTQAPTAVPTQTPTAVPTKVPTAAPSYAGSTPAPTKVPTAQPTATPTAQPTSAPTSCPTASPTPSGYYGGCLTTGFGYSAVAPSSTCLSSFCGQQNRWGWSMGPWYVTQGGFISYKIYAGAGLCDITKAIYVGTGTTTFYPDQNYATITLSISNRLVSEVHAWIGSTKLPIVNGKYVSSPGQWPLNTAITPGTALSWNYTLPTGCKSTYLYNVVHVNVATC